MHKLILIIVFIFSLLFSQAQFNWEVKVLDQVELIINYSLKFQQDSLDPDLIRQENMLLFLGKDISLFASKNSYIAMNQLNKLTTNEERQQWADNRIQNLMTRFQYRIFKNYPETKMTCTDQFMGPPYLFEEDLDLFNWQLTGDTSTIAKHKVQKATCDFGGRSWVAWFTTEILYNDGPYKFNGLPGLILKVHDTREHYVFEFISAERPDKDLMIEYDEMEYIKTTKQGFFQAEDYFHKDIITRVKESGGSIEYQKRAARNMAKHNNPIELKRK